MKKKAKKSRRPVAQQKPKSLESASFAEMLDFFVKARNGSYCEDV